MPANDGFLNHHSRASKQKMHMAILPGRWGLNS